MTLDILLIIGILGKLKKDNVESGSLVLVLGIRPDVIRASILIKKLKLELNEKFILVWSGQHYSDNLKDIFFRELELQPPDIDLAIKGNSDAELVSDMITKLSIVLERITPKAVVFLGDTNTVLGAIACSQLNIPVIHIEGCMRSYDWGMPEEKNRMVVDHLSDFIYAYLESYKKQGISEGIPSSNIIVTGNPIVDVLKKYFISGELRMSPDDLHEMLSKKYNVNKLDFYLMTCHRRENVTNIENLSNILSFVSTVGKKVVFPASYRTQKQISFYQLELPDNLILVDPVGYLEILELMYNSSGVFSDSGTLIEEAAILGIPSIQMRKSTERPQVYDFKSAIKFDPENESDYNAILQSFLNLKRGSWVHSFGDGTASEKIAADLINRYEKSDFRGHQPEKYLPYSLDSYKN